MKTSRFLVSFGTLGLVAGTACDSVVQRTLDENTGGSADSGLTNTGGAVSGTGGATPISSGGNNPTGGSTASGGNTAGGAAGAASGGTLSDAAVPDSDAGT